MFTPASGAVRCVVVVVLGQANDVYLIGVVFTGALSPKPSYQNDEVVSSKGSSEHGLFKS